MIYYSINTAVFCILLFFLLNPPANDFWTVTALYVFFFLLYTIQILTFFIGSQLVVYRGLLLSLSTQYLFSFFQERWYVSWRLITSQWGTLVGVLYTTNAGIKDLALSSKGWGSYPHVMFNLKRWNLVFSLSLHQPFLLHVVSRDGDFHSLARLAGALRNSFCAPWGLLGQWTSWGVSADGAPRNAICWGKIWCNAWCPISCRFL